MQKKIEFDKYLKIFEDKKKLDLLEVDKDDDTGGVLYLHKVIKDACGYTEITDLGTHLEEYFMSLRKDPRKNNDPVRDRRRPNTRTTWPFGRWKRLKEDMPMKQNRNTWSPVIKWNFPRFFEDGGWQSTPTSTQPNVVVYGLPYTMT